MTANRAGLLLGVFLVVLAAIFYFLHVVEAAALPLFIVGVVVALVSLAL